MDKIRSGFTLIEILIVVTILSVVSITAFTTLGKQRTKAEDLSMKTDLTRLKTAFEEYYNDHNCYPPEEWFADASNITGDELRPYLSQIPLNKKTDQPYVLEKDQTGCNWFKIYTTLNNPDDPQAVLLRTLDPLTGSTLGNFGVSSSNTVVSIFYDPDNTTTPTPTPTSTPTPSPTPTSTPTPTPSMDPANHYYCSNIGNCSYFDNTRFNCTPSYVGTNCNGGINICSTAGSCTPL
ncbi:type II secretion system protein [Candidatus Woesebacteria bacterium]|nr:type II secretion system protein [Candidatus Woesebacteria bacterium]